jgi:rhodanese-related sulfurtransferase
MTTQIPSIPPRQLHKMLDEEQATAVIDVRSMAEYRSGHIPGAQLIPIEDLSAEAIEEQFSRSGIGHDETLYLTCLAGPRAQKAAELLHQAGYSNLRLIEGGTQAWQQAGLPMQVCGTAITLERQVQIAIGSLLVMKVLLGFSVHELFFAATAIIGAGLIVAGTTSWCGMARLMALMPWNRGNDCEQQAKA